MKVEKFRLIRLLMDLLDISSPALSVVVSMTVKRLETTKWQNYFLNVLRVDIAVTISSVVEGKEGLNVKAE